MRTVQITPARMVEEDGSVHFGTFRTPFRHANLLDAPLYTFPVPGFWKNFRLKEWQHFGLITPTHYFGMVIFDAKFTAASFFYVYDRLANTRFEHSRKESTKAVHVTSQVYDDACRFDAKGYHLCFENKLDQGFHRILIEIEGDADHPAVRGDLMVHEDLSAIEPLVQVSPITRVRPFYTHKAAAPVSGSLVIDSREMILDRRTAIALIDEQKTYYPYFSFWKWATGAGYSDDGKLLAFNLCKNIIADDGDFNENCFWMDGKITCLKDACFQFSDVLKPWTMKTTDDKLDLYFVPEGERAAKIKTVGILLSDFHQPFGLFNGRFKDDRGATIPVRDCFGLTEQHITRF
ncbi:MAG: DUF2804 domain-containing protein [Deltaproteobacteria bacterium]